MSDRPSSSDPRIVAPLRAAAKQHALEMKQKKGFEKGNNRGKPHGALEITTKGFISKALKNGLNMSPLEYMMTVMMNKNFDVELRLKAAAAAAPYIHHKLVAQTIEATVVAETAEDRMKRLALKVLEAENENLIIEGTVEAAE